MILPLGETVSEGIFGSMVGLDQSDPSTGSSAEDKGRTENPRRDIFSDLRLVSFGKDSIGHLIL